MRRSIRDLRAFEETAIDRECLMCDYIGPFGIFGVPPRFGALCPRCKSLERHRLFSLAVKQGEIALPKSCRVLHFAPERMIQNFVRDRVDTYFTADFMRRGMDLKLNIEKIDLPDDSYDLVICNHVLEHVEPTKALPELFRVLSPGGLAALSFPIVEGWEETYRDASITSREDRKWHFLQGDHIQIYGRSILKMIRETGFELTEFTTPPKLFVRHGLLPGEKIFMARKPAGEKAP